MRLHFCNDGLKERVFLITFELVLNQMDTKKKHWENIYKTKQADEMSWTENLPEISLGMMDTLHLPKTAGIVDIGGGESKLVDCLLDAGYTNITVLDISEESIEKTKKRLGIRAEKIKWITQDITTFLTDELYDCWHDRAAFHFLTSSTDIEQYASLAAAYVKTRGHLIMGTFSERGPKKCSGLPVMQYNPDSLSQVFSNGFQLIRFVFHNHETPSGTKQNFIYCLFRRL